MPAYYLGLSITYHDSAFSILDDQGQVLFAEASERYLQSKRALNAEPVALNRIQPLLQRFCPDANHFILATNWNQQRPWYEKTVSALGCLNAKGLLKTGIKRLNSPLKNYQLHHMIACQRNQIQSAGLSLVRILAEHYPTCIIDFSDFPHHRTHAAYACFSSPFQEAACAVIDSFGENGSMAFYHFKDQQLKLIYESKGTGSLGFLYMKLTELCGFNWLKGEEWKVMGMASYGQLDETFYTALKNTIEISGFQCKHRGKFLEQNLQYLDSFQCHDGSHFQQLANIAYTGQYFFCEVMSILLNQLQLKTGAENLTIAGGCALNSSFNGQIKQRTEFKQIHIPSAPADDGCSVGAGWLALRKFQPQITINPQRKRLNPYLGSEIDPVAIQRFIQFNRTLQIEHLPERICEMTADLLARGKLIGWVQGRAEFGPRALGNRSILADPRKAKVKDHINQSIKFREPFRPFAPSILAEYADDYFEKVQASPYMDKTLSIKANKRQLIAGVCHVDHTGRLQTVDQDFNPRFYALIHQFYLKTQIPVLLNTSFNVMGKPLIHTLEDALAVFLTSGLDALVIDDYLITKPDSHA